MLQLISEQLKSAEQGEAVRIQADGKAFILLSHAVYEDELDFSPWTQPEMDLLTDEAMQLISGDGFDEAAEFPRAK